MNRRHGWIDYHERLARVTAHIHDHLDQALALEELAEIACLSPYHWHRVYHALYGETIAATIRRVRLHRATGYLANTTLAVAQVARRCGYPNTQSFTRAFASAYGMAPAQYRRVGGHALFRQHSAPAAPDGYAVEIRYVDAVTLAGVAHTGSYMRIGKAFEHAFAAMAAARQVHEHTRWLAAYHDDPAALPEAQLHAWAGLSLDPGAQAPAPLQTRTLGGCTCAVLRHRGPYATMGAAYQWLYGQWLVQSGHAALDQPVFEEYLNNPRHTAPAELLTDICLPLLDSDTPRA